MAVYECLALITLGICSFFLMLNKRRDIFNYFKTLKHEFQIVRSAISSEKLRSTQPQKDKNIENQFSQFLLPLSPTSKADEDGKYSEALKWALDEDDILNIAITGPYGSGKTSVLKTFFLKHKYNYLNVSLAKFSQSHDVKANYPRGDKQVTNSETGSVEDEDISDDSLNKDYLEDSNGFLLEKSILQQILYAEEQKKLPYSRFARVHDYSLLSKLSLAIPFLFFIAILFAYSFEREWLEALVENLNTTSPLISLAVYSLTLFTGVWLIILMFDFFRSLRIDKFNLFSGEFQFSESHGASALNIHLDELIYFFEVTRYRVIVFEDLDRFSNTTIFTKLREMNTLINNSKQVNKKPSWLQNFLRPEHRSEPVRFIYAVKDELFSDAKDRTKFFDFVLPIIPYVSDKNSRQLLIDKLRAIGKLDDEFEHIKWKNFVRDVTLYVDDMRLLTNIFNEFLIYEAKLLRGFKQTDSRMLFAFILYKNKYPKDFSDLYEGKGYIQAAFNNKRTLISKEITSASKNIKTLESEIEEIKAESLQSLKELRTVILGSLVNSEPTRPLQIHAGTSWEPVREYIDSEEKFEALLTIGTINIHKENAQISLSKNNIYNNDWKGEYKRRKKLLDENKTIKILSRREEINRLKQKQQELRLFSLAELLENSEFDGSLLELLIRKGYINESFSDYLNFFHDGDLSIADKDFVFSVKSKNPLPYENHIQNIQLVLEELDEADFKVAAILNYQLIEHLLSSNFEDKRLTHIYKRLSETTPSHSQFIEEFLRTSPLRVEFAVQLAKAWPNFWLNISEFLSDDNLKTEIANNLIYSLSLNELVEINIEHSLSLYLTNHSAVFTDFKNIKEEKFIGLITKLEIVFEDLTDFLNIFPSSVNSILDLNAYEINVNNLRSLFNILSERHQHHFPNFSELTLLDNRLEDHLEANRKEYIVNYLLEVNEIVESEKTLETFLNDDELDVYVKASLIESIDFKITQIDSLQDKALWTLLINNQRVIPSWRNVLIIFTDDDEPYTQTIKFMEENIDELCEQGLDEKTYREEFGYSYDLHEFFLPVIYSGLLPLSTIDKMLGLSGYYLADIDLTKLSIEVINLLVEKEYIQLTAGHITQISLVSTESTIKFIDNNAEKFSSLEKYPHMKGAVLVGVLALDKLSDSDVILTLTSQFSDETYELKLSDEESDALQVALKKRNLLVLSTELLISLLAVMSLHSTKLKLLNQQLPNLNGDDISRCLSAIGLKKVSDAYKKGSNVTIDPEMFSEELLESLKQKGYVSTGYLKKNKYKMYFRQS